jgi:hypothetical protein
MKTRLVILFCFFGSQVVTFGQADELEKIKAPSSPAAAVIGIQPTTVLSPKSYEALEASVLSNFFNGQGQLLIPNDFGLEFSPYWAMDHPMTIQQYLFPGFGESLWRNLSFSVASTQNYVLKDTVKSKALGFGIRTTIYITDNAVRKVIDSALETLNISQAAKSIIDTYIYSIDEKLIKTGNTAQFVDMLIDSLKKEKYMLVYFSNDRKLMEQELLKLGKQLKKELPVYSPGNEKIFLDSINNFVLRYCEVSKKLQILESYVTNRPGFKLDIAGAFSLDFPKNDFNFSITPQQSVWLTPSYRFRGNTSFIEILGVLRYNWYNMNFYQQYFKNKETYEHNFDYGISLNLLFKKISLHFEAVGQYSNTIIDKTTDPSGIVTTRSKTKSDFQYVGTFSYQINKKLILSYSFGKQFQPVLNVNGTLISVVGLNFGFGGPTKDNLTNF